MSSCPRSPQLCWDGNEVVRLTGIDPSTFVDRSGLPNEGELRCSAR